MATKSVIHFLRRKNGSRKHRGVETLNHPETLIILHGDAKITSSFGKMRTSISNSESWTALQSQRTDMPQKIKTIGGAGHCTTIHMSMIWSIGAKERFFLPESFIEL
jgi:hypothetical protein